MPLVSARERKVYIMTFCTKCLEIFYDDLQSNLLHKAQKICPKVDCNGELMRVDELLAPIVITLYQKGYRHIVDCCSGHAHRPNSALHICFNDNALIDDCPEEWEIVNSGDNTIICKHIETKDLYKKQAEIFKGIMQLWSWAKNLDDCS